VTRLNFGPRSFETSSTDKIMFPDAGITKGELIRYYRQIAPAMLPHIENRRHRVTHSTGWLFSDRRYAGEPRLPGLATLACVEATRTEAGRTGTSRRYYLSSARLTPEAFAHAVRAHWAIENALHWVLDVTFDEDRARNRRDNGPENLAILRRLTLNLLNKARPKMSVARKRKRSGWSDAFARTVIGQMR
jgi:predicted transposase YbfD/YdcC